MKRSFACALLLLAACGDDPVRPDENLPPPEPAAPSAQALGLVEITLSGIGSSDLTASASEISPHEDESLGLASVPLRPLPTGATGGIQLEAIGTGHLTEGTRGVDGQRYLYATFRVRNARANGTAYDSAHTNLTFLAVGTASTIGGAPVSRLNRFDGTAATPSIASLLVPAGAVRQDQSLEMQSQYADVLQVYTEAEVAEFAVPPTVTNVFPYGFVVRNPSATNNRTLPASPGQNQFDGLVTFAFRIPLQPHDPGQTNGPQKDPFTVSFVFLAVADPVTRVTESIEEQTAEGRAAVAARVSALGATMVTVLPGSPSTSYPGLRRLCDVRTAGTAASPITKATSPGAFSRVEIYEPGHTKHACNANFRDGSAGRPGVGLPFNVMVYAMDRYGNQRTAVQDTIKLSSTDATATMPSHATLANGERQFTMVYTSYGTSTLTARSLRRWGSIPVNVAGITRNWTGTVSTNWNVGGNWAGGAVPAALDSVVIPQSAPHQPILVSTVSIGGVTVDPGATLNLSAFDLTASANVQTGTTGGISSSSGRLVLAGIARTVTGVVPRLRVTGTYSLTGNLTVQAPLEISAGRLTDGAFRIQVNN